MTPGERLQHYLARFFALRQHEAAPAAFTARLARLRAFQAHRLRQTHADLFSDPQLCPALEFILDDIYGGANLLAVAGDIRRALPVALKLLPARVMATSACALEVAVLTQELDEAMLDRLADKLDGAITEADYINAYQALGHIDERQQQLEKIAELGGYLERHLRSRLLQTSFKLVKQPAHRAGFAHLYDFMERCFAVMKPLPDAARLLAELSGRETVIMQQLFADTSTPFVIDRQAS